jgi:hypothetical protein
MFYTRKCFYDGRKSYALSFKQTVERTTPLVEIQHRTRVLMSWEGNFRWFTVCFPLFDGTCAFFVLGLLVPGMRRVRKPELSAVFLSLRRPVK